MPKLLIHRNSVMHSQFSFSGVDHLTIGRSRESDIVLPDELNRVSRCHAAVVRMAGHGERYMIRDLGSRRGLRVDGERVYQRPLRDGSVVELAGYRLAYSEQNSMEEELPPIRVGARDTHAAGHDTARLTTQGSVEREDWSDGQKELAENLLRASSTTGSFMQLLAETLEPLGLLLGAERGFAAVVREEGIHSVARFRLGRREQITIADPEFLDRLREGQLVVEQGTLLAAIGRRSELGAFLCLERHSPFSTAECDYIRAVTVLLNSLRQPKTHQPESGIVFAWPSMLAGRGKHAAALRQQVDLAARGGMNVLVLGESGTGKEMVSRAIHASSGRRGPFVAQNCAAIPDTLAEAELFGYAGKSGIANADPAGKPGWFELADGGTLLLDEVQAFSISSQEKLLRVLQFKEVWRLGARRPTPVDVQVIAATDQDLDQAVEQNRFREALYYRFGQRITVPPLRQRPDDVILLAFYFLDRAVHNLDSGPRTISYRALQALQRYDWPGNVRQLDSEIRAAVSRAYHRETLFSWDIECLSRPEGPSAAQSAAEVKPMRDLEREKICEALESTGGNITKAGKLLGYRSRQTMLNKMDAFGIARNHGDPEAEKTER